MSKEIYISIDIEADGPIPGEYSMLSLGAAAFDPATDNPLVPINTFEVTLKPLPGAKQDPETMKWWGTQPKAWAAVTRDQQDPEKAMQDFVAWLHRVQKTSQGKLVLVGYPATYDFMFVYWYTVKFTGFPTPFGFQGLDIKTLAMSRLGGTFKEATKRNFPPCWFRGTPEHTHKALDDAIGQGVLLMNILKDRRESHEHRT